MGVRLPENSGELTKRDHYDNAIASSYAEQGYLKFAELLEAGHGCAACHLTHFINRVPQDEELDLDRYVTVAALMRGTRTVTEIVATGYIGAVESMELKLARESFRITTANATGPLDAVTLRQIGREITSNPVAHRSYAQLQRQGTEVVFDFGEAPFGFMGKADRARNRVFVYVQAHRSPKEIVSTMAHEASHIHRHFRGSRATQLDEVRAFSREFVYEHGRRPTPRERMAIRDHVRREYSHLPEE